MKLRFLSLSLLASTALYAAVFGSVRGIVHDPDHRPIQGAQVTLQSTTSDYALTLSTKEGGAFEATALPAGAYRITVARDGFEPAAQSVLVTSGSAPVLHFQLQLAAARDTVTVSENALAVSPEVMTPTTVVTRREIQETPGADLTNSLAMITSYVPGAWIAHDQLHVRGGHQVTWAIDGVPIPNTNIASNVGPQIDPKDIDSLEAQRGGYSSDFGDRTYGVFNAIPRTGFERNNEAELNTTFGSFYQTNDQLNFGSHTEKFAYYGSVSGNRSNYGLETPGPAIAHDRVWGLGGLATLLYNRDANNQYRLVASVRGDDYQIPAADTDRERERDAVLSSSWAHTLRPGTLLTISPFYHYNQANYDGADTTQHRASSYAGAQLSLSEVTARHNAKLGVYGFGQQDEENVRLPGFQQDKLSSGHLEAVYLEDQYRATSWLTLTAGARLTHFTGRISENAATPRLGGSVRIPHLNWILRGFWGRYYQAPPLSTVSGEDLVFIPLRGERDEEHQFGLTIPVRGWSLEVNAYHQRARNYFDHNAIQNSNAFFPLTIAGARLYGREVALRSPRLFHRGELYLAYAWAHAQGAGAITGGLSDGSVPDPGYFPLDHDQRHTLHTGGSTTLPWKVTASAGVYYGSGFAGGLEPHTTFDMTLGKPLNESVFVSLTALNATNRRFLLDNSATFGGTHYADPRQIYVSLRYRLHY